MVSVRMDPDLKRRIEEAARTQGQSFTSFVVGAAVAAAKRIKPERRVSSLRGPRPAFFRVLCSEAAKGGSGGYHRAGYELARNLADLVEPEELDGLLARIESFSDKEMSARAFERGILDWLTDQLTNCMAIVPQRRFHHFAAGVLKYHEDHGIER